MLFCNGNIESVPYSTRKMALDYEYFHSLKAWQRANKQKTPALGQSDPSTLKPEEQNLVAQTACGFRISCTRSLSDLG